MPFTMKIQPIDDSPTMIEPNPDSDFAKPVLKSRFRRLFRFDCTSGVSSTADFEPSTVCLVKMVQNFMEESSDKQSAPPSAKFGRNRRNCFTGNGNDASDDEFDLSHGDSSDTIKSLISCSSMAERNLLAETAKIVEQQQSKSFESKRCLRTIVAEGLSRLGYDASVCKSRWEKSSSHPPGEYEYIDVIVNGEERLLIDVDFRSEFEIARSTKGYEAIVQSLPLIFVGEAERLGRIVFAVSEAARRSLERKGMHMPPWRKPEYMKAKWLAPYTRGARSAPEEEFCGVDEVEIEVSELKLMFGEEMECGEVVVEPPWEPPALTPRSAERRNSKVTGLSSLFKERL